MTGSLLSSLTIVTNRYHAQYEVHIKMKSEMKAEVHASEDFANAKSFREQNIQRLEQSNDEFHNHVKGLEARKDETKLKLDLGVKVLNPYYEYESKPEWEDFMRQTLLHNLKLTDEAIVQYKDKISDNDKALKSERLRLKLINQGIPAWVDSEFKKHSHE